jgi:membrane protease YdiL (CAAX protease family)
VGRIESPRIRLNAGPSFYRSAGGRLELAGNGEWPHFLTTTGGKLSFLGLEKGMRMDRNIVEKLRAFEPIHPFGRYVMVASILEITLDIAVLLALALVLIGFGVDLGSLLSNPKELTFLSAVILAPLFETFILAGLISLLLKANLKPLVVATASAIAWGLLHTINGPTGFFAVTVGFFVQSYSYIVWRKQSFSLGYAAAAIPHMANNLFAFAMQTVFR